MKKFDVGQIIMTAGIMTRAATDAGFLEFITDSFKRFIKGDWGNVSDDEKNDNDLAVKHGDDRIMAMYEKDNQPVYIITEWDRSVTTILFAEEY